MVSLAVSLVALGLVYMFLLWRYRQRTIGRIPGPLSPSWIYGNLKEYLLDVQYGTIEFKWTSRFGPFYRIKGCFGQDLLVISDPTALKYVFGNLQYFSRSSFALQALRAMLPRSEKSILAAEGDNHARYRNIMNGAFTVGRVKALVPNLTANASNLIEQWRATLAEGNQIGDIYHSLFNLTLDAAGTAIGTEINAVGNTEADIVKSLHDLSFIAGKRSAMAILVQKLFLYLPTTILRLVLLLPTTDFLQLRHTKAVSKELSDKVIRNHLEALGLNLERGQDIFDVIVRNNAATPSPRNMSKEELSAQISALILAAQDTTANTLAWALYELAKDPEWQEQLRAEIFANYADPMSGDGHSMDFDALKYLNEHIKETLRYHSTIPFLDKIVSKDTVIPLSTPLTTTTGERITEVPVEKGQVIYLAMSSYNRLESIWGKDAHEFNPRRWEEGAYSKGQSVGLYANLISFGHGPKSCIGWRYALAVLQVTLVELVRAFKITLPEGAVVRRSAVLSLVPTSEDGTPSLPLIIQPI